MTTDPHSLVPLVPLASAPRALPGWIAFFVIFLTVLGSEWAVRAGYTPPGELSQKAATAVANLAPDRPDILIFGTCIGTEAINHEWMEQEVGRGGKVHRLTAPGAFPMDWYLTMRGVLDPAQVDAVVLIFTTGDLSTPALTWQTQTYDLMDWVSMQEVADWSCTTLACREELYLRASSLLYRNRAYLANLLWTGIGARAKASPPRRRRHAAPQNAKDEGSWHFVQRILELTRERGTPAIFVELPRNPALAHEPAGDPEIVRRLEARLDRLGAEYIHPPPPPEGYIDDVHFNAKGQVAITAAILDELRRRGIIEGAAPPPAGDGG
jgi:hypothetical protein